MNIAIMQPYFFPYIGYFQLINVVDKFIVYDDVNYINRGWINRNRILINNKAEYMTIPLSKASQNKLINEIEVIDDTNWKTNILRKIEHSYKKSENFNAVYAIVKNVLFCEEKKVVKYVLNSIKEVCKYLSIKTSIVESSATYCNSHLKSQQRIIDIIKKEDGKHYFNLIGGVNLYARTEFEKENIEISFIKSNDISYSQRNDSFIPYLSIIDVMMFNNKSEIRKYLQSFELI